MATSTLPIVLSDTNMMQKFDTTSSLETYIGVRPTVRKEALEFHEKAVD